MPVKNSKRGKSPAGRKKKGHANDKQELTLRDQLSSLAPEELLKLAHPNSIAWKHALVIDPVKTTDLLNMNPAELGSHVEQECGLRNIQTDLRSMIVRDFYVCAIWFVIEHKLTLQQASAAVNLCHILLTNIKEERMSLNANVAYFQSAMAVATSEQTQLEQHGTPTTFKAAVLDFEPATCELLTDFLMTGLFQHYRMYVKMFHEEREEDIQLTKLIIEVPGHTPSLDEGRSRNERLQREANLALEALTLGGSVPEGLEPEEAHAMAEEEVLKALEAEALAHGLEVTDARRKSMKALAAEIASSLLVPPAKPVGA